MRGRAVRFALVAMLLGVVLGMAGCGMPPALTKAQLDSKKVSSNHPKMTEKQKENCRSCHREAPAIKKQP